MVGRMVGDGTDRQGWVQDTLGVDPESFATGDGTAAAPVGAAGNMLGADGGAVPLDGGDAGAGASNETPTMNPTSPVPNDIHADTAVEFVNAANNARGGGGEVGHMAPNITIDPTFDANGKVDRVNMTVGTSIVRPRWSGGRPNDVQKAAIKKAEQLIKEHEERHRDIARDYATRAVRAMHGKTAAAAQKLYDDTMKQMDAAQKALDQKEGGISVKESGGGATVDVSLGPAPP